MGYRFEPPPRKDGERLIANGMGFLWQVPMDRGTGGASLALTSGTQYYTICPLYGGETITGLAVDVQTNGTSLTLVKVGLVSEAGVLLAQSADNKANFGSGGVIVATPFTTPYTPPADSAAYAVIVCTHTGTGPACVRINGGSYTPSIYSSRMRPFGVRTGLSDISANTPNANGACFWFAAY